MALGGENRAKRRLFSSVHAALEAAGVFVNWDLYREEGEDAPRGTTRPTPRTA